MPRKLIKGAQSLCGGCGEVFATLSDFDSHRTGKFGQVPPDRRCMPPGNAGLELVDGCWGTPEGNANRNVKAARMQQIRSRSAT